MQIALNMLAWLGYPGFLFTIALAALHAALTLGLPWIHTATSFCGAMFRPSWWNHERSVNGISIVLASAGMALLPWPWHPTQPDPVAWLWAWSAFEAAFLVALLPALVAGTPPVVRSAIRTAQIGVLGRSLLWLALGAGLMLHNTWDVTSTGYYSPLLAHGLALLTALFAFPAAVGWGMFAGETTITPGDTEHGLDAVTITFAHSTHIIRTAALLAASLVALLPVALLPPALGLLLVVVGFVAASVLMERLDGRYPRLTLPGALQVCLWRALPPGVATVIYMSLV